MSRRRRGRITVQNQPTGAERVMMRGMGVIHAVMGFVFYEQKRREILDDL